MPTADSKRPDRHGSGTLLEARNALIGQLARLPCCYRTAGHLTRPGNNVARAIAAALGVTPDAVPSGNSRMLERLGEYLSRR